MQPLTTYVSSEQIATLARSDEATSNALQDEYSEGLADTYLRSSGSMGSLAPRFQTSFDRT